MVVQLLISSCLSGDSDTIYDIQDELPFHGMDSRFNLEDVFQKVLGLSGKTD